MTTLPLVIILVGLSASSCAASKHAISSDLNLYSWRISKTEYAFVLVPKRDNEQFLRKFDPRIPHLSGIAQLERELAELPKGSSITWRDYEGVGLTFPPATVRRKIQQFAAAQQIDIEVVPTIYD